MMRECGRGALGTRERAWIARRRPIKGGSAVGQRVSQRGGVVESKKRM